MKVESSATRGANDTRHILITGNSRGIGKALTEHLLSRGDKVIGCSRQCSETTHENYCHIQADLTCPDEIDRLMAQVRAELKYLDVLINNAGAAGMTPAALQPPSASRKIVDLNLNAVLHVTHNAIRLLRRGKSARIVNLSTVAVPWRLEGEAVYSATKAAVEQWTRVLAKELGPLGITCNAIGPSPIKTDLIRGVPPDKINALIQRQAIPRFAEMRDVIHLLEFLVHPQSDFISGQVIYLGGAS